MNYMFLVAYFLGGACFTNAVPHLISGLTGRCFPNLFSRPVGVGLSPPVVNFIWGWTNLAFGYLLIFRVGTFDVRVTPHIVAVAAGSLIIGLMLARHFGNLFAD